MSNPSETYRDGVGVERCQCCHYAVLDAAGHPLVYVRAKDVAGLLAYLKDEADDEPWLRRICERLSRAIGRPLP